MSKKLYRKTLPKPEPVNMNTVLPIDHPVANYYRQSTDAQVGNQSTAMQTIDMPSHLMQLGWSKDNIIMIDMDAGVSGTTKIDERKGMRWLYELIIEGKISAVACQDEDRLFRDITQIQVNIFIDACKQSKVLVITPTMTYDFAHPVMGVFHARQFRFKCEMGAEYLNTYLRDRLHPAKKRIMMEGKWAGCTVPVGYMVDTREKLEDESVNPSYRHYVPYEPFAQIVNEYFNIFLKNAGNISATVRQIVKHGPFFPNPKEWQAPAGFRFVSGQRMRNYMNGYCPGEVGLTGMFRNATYIGHWAVDGTIVHYNNHAPLVPLDIFMSAYNYLSPVLFNGEPNPHYSPFQQQRRPSREVNRPKERPLLSGMIFSEVKGTLRRAGTHWNTGLKEYGYCCLDKYPIETVLWWKKTDYVDEAVVKFLRGKLAETFDPIKWAKNLAAFSEEYDKDRKVHESQIAAIERTMSNLIKSLETLTNPFMIKKVQARYEEAEREHERQSEILRIAAQKTARFDALHRLKDNIEVAINNWVNLSLPDQQVMLHSFIEKIVVEPMPKSAIHITIFWYDGKQECFDMARQGATYLEWLVSDEKRLISAIDKRASQLEIASMFPNRTWNMIRTKVYAIRGKGAIQLTPKPIADDESYMDYLVRTNGGTLPHQARNSERWLAEEIDQLTQMVNEGKTQIEIMEVFSHRNWSAIRRRITHLCGAEVKVSATSDIRVKRTETYYTYLARVAAENDKTGEISLADMAIKSHQ
jgi:hypothetical protein